MVTTTAPLRVVFFGTPEFAVPTLNALLSSRHVVAGVVSQPDRPRGRGQHLQPSPVKEVAANSHLPLLQPDRLRDAAFLSALTALRADLGVVAAYGKILSDAVLQVPRLGMINVHASLLPKYRGAAPIHRAVMAGDSMTGVTIMRVVKALDAGPMLARSSRPIEAEETSQEVERDLAQVGATLLVQVLDQLSGGDVAETPQDEGLATYAHKLQKRDGVIEWSAAAKAIHDQIRGLHPWPHAFSDLDGARCLLLESRVDAHDGAAAAGTVIEAQGDALRIRTGDGALRILRLQMEGRRAMTAREFLAGRRIAPGTAFTRPNL
jgi:methionyl-tRNA formyltransferase